MPRGWRSCWTRWRSGRRHSHSFGRSSFIQHLFPAIEQGVTGWSMSATTSISSSSPSPQDPTQHGSSNLGTGEEDLWQGQLHHLDGRDDQSWPPRGGGTQAITDKGVLLGQGYLPHQGTCYHVQGQYHHPHLTPASYP